MKSPDMPGRFKPRTSRSDTRLGLEVSLGQLLERGLLQLRFGQQSLERGVLLLQLLETLRVVGLQSAVLVTPPVIRLLGYPKLPTHRGDVAAVGEHPVGLPELADDLLRGVTLPDVRHDLTSLPARNHGRQDDSQNHRTYETGSAQVYWYNNERLHESLGYVPPTEHEASMTGASHPSETAVPALATT